MAGDPGSRRYGRGASAAPELSFGLGVRVVAVALMKLQAGLVVGFPIESLCFPIISKQGDRVLHHLSHFGTYLLVLVLITLFRL